MKSQYEQQCNAAALKQMGVKVIKSLKKRFISAINDWLKSETVVHVLYEDNLEQVIDLIFKKHADIAKVSPLLSIILKDSNRTGFKTLLTKSGM